MARCAGAVGIDVPPKAIRLRRRFPEQSQFRIWPSRPDIVAAGTDDAEERANGTMALASTDLDFFNDRYGNGGEGQHIGIRFTGIAIPTGAVITSAYLQFHTDEKDTAPTSMLIRGEDSDDADMSVVVRALSDFVRRLTRTISTAS